MHIPGYDVADDLGRRGPYALLRATRRGDSCPVLLKVAEVPPGHPHDLDALSREFALLRDLSFPGVPRAYDLLRSGSSACLVLEDRGLRPVLRLSTPGAADLRGFFTLARHLCAILGDLHARRVVHAGLCPAAVFGSPALDDVQIVDLHRAFGPSETRAPEPVPPTPWISPEQTGRIDRPIDYRTDLYSLGATLYEWLTGAPPFRSDDPLELVHAHLARVPAAPSSVDPSIPDQVSRVVLRLLAKAAEDRYQSSLGLARDLAECERQWTSTGAIAPFEPGSRDVPERFLAPQKLYGRDREIRRLLDAFERTGAGGPALLLVSGYAGIGKTSLIQELYRPIVRERGYFASGKFDQVLRNIPHGAIIQALRGLVWQLLTEPEDRLARWRDALQAALGGTAGVLAEVVPEVELILGGQDPPPPLDPAEAQNRFRYALQTFVRAMATPGHPLVLFLDDLQWVDPATLDVLHGLLTSPDIRHLLIIGAYRDNEVEGGHPLMAMVDRLVRAPARIEQVALSPLSPADLTAFLTDSFRAAPGEVAPLAELVHRKTGGNPFFGIQFLQALEQDELVTFDRTATRWAFRLDAIARAGQTDNIIDLMTRRIRRLSAAGQRAITLAACIGSRFDWRTFAGATRQAADEAAAGLSEALQAGLVHLTGTTTAGGPPREPAYAFLHDRVQQAAYALIPDDQKAQVHLEVGRLLLDAHGGEPPDDLTFEIANHLNMGRQHIGAPAERVSVARVNLSAGRKAKASAAYTAAAGYLESGMALLDDDHWHTDYDLAFPLHLEAAECHYLAGAFDLAERDFARLEEHAATTLDRAQVHSLRIVLAENQGQWHAAVTIGQVALAALGLDLPADVKAGSAALDREMTAIEQALDGRPIASLIDLTAVTDADVRMAMRILTNLWAPAYISGDPVLARLISAMLVRLSLVHGNTEDSAYGYVTHAITVGPIKRQYAAAYEWGELALAVSERFQDTRRRAKIHQQFQAHVSYWCRPFDRCIPHAREARRIGMENGDFTYAGYGAMSESWPAFLTSRDLRAFLDEHTPTLTFLERLKMSDFLAAHHVVLAWARALQGRTAGRLSLSDDQFDERSFLDAYEGRDPFFLMFFYAARLHVSVLLEEYEEACDVARRARAAAVAGTIWPVFIDFWGAMALAARVDRMSAEDQRAAREQLRSSQQALAGLESSCPENFRCWAGLLSAEIARLDGDLDRAAALCNEALAWARSTGSVQHEAPAHERLAQVWRARGFDAEALTSIADAHRAYVAWGATAKTADIERRYGIGGVPAPSRAATGSADASPTPPAVSSAIDMATVVKLAHSIAVEVRVGGLIETLMSLVLENAGADRGAFLLERDGRLVVVATATADPPAVRVDRTMVLDESPEIAPSVVRYVHRTRQDVALGVPGADDRFAGDPRIATGRARSILCVPVGHQGATRRRALPREHA
jgi:predicted ATPase